MWDWQIISSCIVHSRTNVESSSTVFCGLHLTDISQEILMNFIRSMCSQITSHTDQLICMHVPFTVVCQCQQRIHTSNLCGICWGLYASVNYTIIGPDNSLSHVWRRDIISTNAGLLSIGPLWTYFSEIWIKYNTKYWLLENIEGKHV